MATFLAFNFARENEIFQNIIAFYDRERYGVSSEKLGYASSSWHRLWTLNRDQIKIVVKSDYISQADVERSILQSKTRRQSLPVRDQDYTIDCVSSIIEQIRGLTPLEQEIVFLRGRKTPIHKLIHRFPIFTIQEISAIYYSFIKAIHSMKEFQYLAFLRNQRSRSKNIKSKKRASKSKKYRLSPRAA